MPKVSVIIAVYNGARTIAKSVQSAQIQTFHDIEIIVADDASTDNTCAVVTALAQQDPRIKLCRRQVNGGPGAARNAAIQEASGEWIAILDADDWMQPHRLEEMLAAAEKCDADIVGDNMEIFDHATNTVADITNFCASHKIQTVDARKYFSLDNPLRRHSIGYVQPIIKRSFLIKHGIAYKADHRIGEDFLLLAEILMQGGKFIVIPEAYYVYRHTFSPTTRKKSAESHTSDRYDLIVRGCDELLEKYGTTMSAAAKKALKQRRSIFKKRIALKLALQSLQEKRFTRVLQIIRRHPYVLVLIGAAVSKFIYANIIRHIRDFDDSMLYVPSDSSEGENVGSDTPRATIVIAVLNGMKTIQRAIESAQYQTIRNIEILIVDDGSTDGTPEFVESISTKDARVKCIRLEKNVGAAAATNIAISRASSDWIAILDADDWYEPQRIEKLLKTASDEQADVVCDNLRIYDHVLNRMVARTNFGRRKKSMLLTTEYFFHQDNPIRRTAIGYIKPMMRRKFLVEHKLAYESYHRVGYDFLLMAEILLNKAKVIIIPGAYYDYVHMFSPTTRKQSPHSHTKSNYGQIIQGCNELLTKYSKDMSNAELKALIHRRYMFESRLRCNDMVAAWHEGRVAKSLEIIIQWPFILVIMAAAVLKMLYANMLNILWHLKLRRTVSVG